MDHYNIPVQVSRSESYPVLIGVGLADDIYGCIQRHLETRSGFYTLVDEAVADLYRDVIGTSFARAGSRGAMVRIRSGEHRKTLTTYAAVIDELLEKEMRRRSILVVIGGGVAMDVGGFVGATYMRGVQVVNVPTTLVAQADAAIGGKVGVNHHAAKNLVGAFHNPKLVIADPRFLTSLEPRQIREGVAEIIKVAVIASEELFGRLEADIDGVLTKDLALVEQLLLLAVQTKVSLLVDDPLERDLQRVLNFGHTLGHVIETITAYGEVTHGEAVAIGMAAATRFAARKGYCDAGTGMRILDLLQRAGLPTEFFIHGRASAVVAGLERVKLVRDGNLNLVVPIRVGKAEILRNVDLSDLISSLDSGHRGS